MELEGLKRTVKWLLEVATMAGLEIECIITDRHLQVAKWIRENLLCYKIKHYYDVWHIAKCKYYFVIFSSMTLSKQGNLSLFVKFNQL